MLTGVRAGWWQVVCITLSTGMMGCSAEDPPASSQTTHQEAQTLSTEADTTQQNMPENPKTSNPSSQKAPEHQPNRLINEKSPYLLQHAYNPVRWYPWGDEAFAKAKKEDKPILVSIGYSTCYWCHVMETESFDNAAIAKLINETVVPIKVDREERPDLDAIYMSAVTKMSGQGGWPLNVFLTPEGKPFYGGTYFPPEDRWGRPGFPTILRSIDKSWKERREALLRSSEQLTQAIDAASQFDRSANLDEATLQKAVSQLAARFDATHGGFGGAPKFPTSHNLSFLLRAWSRDKNPQTLAMVEKTLEAMAKGGIHDHLGGGFHRYSTDEKWLVPHFEKMLYDQALIARAYTEAYQVTKNPLYAQAARDTLEYVLRDLRDGQGAFYSAEDAGEVGAEGEFYVWTPGQVEEVLGLDAAKRFNKIYDVTDAGNFEHDQSILNEVLSVEALAQQEGVSVDELKEELKALRDKLFEVREKRERPHLDDKILTDWNGLMIGTLSIAARVLDEPEYAQAAQAAAIFIVSNLKSEDRLLHRYRDGKAEINGFLDDYAFLSWGLFELYESTFEVRWLQESKDLTDSMIQQFWDEKSGGFWFSGKYNEQLIARTKELYDGALPSGNSIAALNLTRLAVLTMDDNLKSKAAQTFQTFSGQVEVSPASFTQFITALDFSLGPTREIVIAGDTTAEDVLRMVDVVNQRFMPRTILVIHPTGDSAAAIDALAPFVAMQNPMDGKATAYVCQNYVCNLPTTEIERLIALLDAEPVSDRQ